MFNDIFMVTYAEVYRFQLFNYKNNLYFEDILNLLIFALPDASIIAICAKRDCRMFSYFVTVQRTCA